jgi:SAM-dependent methyltransferase
MDPARRPLLASASDHLRRSWPVLHGALDSLEQRLTEAELDRCEGTIGMLRRALDEEALRRALDAVADFTVMYLREQVAFRAIGRYSKTSFEEAGGSVYLDDQLMSGVYLPGLYLTQVFWPVHVKMDSVFEERFLPLLPRTGVAMEIGVGHGWTFVRTLMSGQLRGVGFDFSPSSLEFTRTLALANGVGPSRFTLIRGDVRERLAIDDGQADCAVMGEVLEHVPDAEGAARELRRGLRRGGMAYVTTAIDSPAIDHITNWPDPEAVDTLLRDAGFDIVERHIFRPADLVVRPTRFVDTTKDYVAILRAR